jgi:hypothetical protein
MKTQIMNLKTSLWFFTLLMTFTFFSCEKDKTSTYSGRILSYGTLEPIPDAVVYIIAGKAVGILEPAQEWVLDSVKTDVSGKFRITAKEGDYHRIGKISKEGYYSDLPGQVTSLVTAGPLANKDYIIDPKGVLHVIIENDPNVEGDFIEIKLPAQGAYDGTFNKIEKTYSLRSDRHQVYYYQIDSKPSIKDSIFCFPFDTTYLHIKF